LRVESAVCPLPKREMVPATVDEPIAWTVQEGTIGRMSPVKIDASKLHESFDRHRALPEVSIDQYVRSRELALADSVLTKQRVYLDKNYWVLVREAAMGRTTPEAAHALLAGLRSRVTSGGSICPISESLFMELMKQSDLETRNATAELIDELSLGVTLVPHETRVATEIAHFIHSRAGRDVYPIETLVWSKLSYVLGVQHPVSEAFDPAEMRVIQKAFFDHMWQCSLVEMVGLLADSPPPSPDHGALAEKLNGESDRHASELASFQQAYKAEIRGSLSIAMLVARQVLEELATGRVATPAEAPDAERRAHEHQLLEYFCGAIKERESAVALRTLHIGALCHAAVRWDKKRRLTGNDLFDFHHAEAAVGYCDVFLTDGPLHTLLQQRHIKIAEFFSCRIISSLEDAAKYFAVR
jgi:hypothetical protein